MTTPHATDPTRDPTEPAFAAPILAFWFADGLQHGWPSQDMSAVWFGASPDLDQDINQKFGPWVPLAAAGGLSRWEAMPLTRLALVLLLDQFSRNIYRGQAQAFAGDARAQALVQETLAQGLDQPLPWVARVFTYMPLMHAEDLALQEEGVRRFTDLEAQAPAELKPTLASHLSFARQHRDIIGRFGRFPHRNAVLGRASTAGEQEYLQTGPRFGQ